MLKTIASLLRSPAGRAILGAVLDIVKSLRSKGRTDAQIQVRIESIRDQVLASDAKDAALLDKHFPPGS